MGMNLDDLPNVGFWPLMGYSAAASLVLFLLLMLWYVARLHLTRPSASSSLAHVACRTATRTHARAHVRYSKMHHFIFRRFWAREAAVLRRHHQLPSEVEEEDEDEDEEDKYDLANGSGSSSSGSALHRLRPHAASAAAESDTTPLLFRG
jgi:hypothetical protein